MLSLGAASSCDVCLERFGQDLKAPCSISCGHVFCVDCISHISRLCPLCRTPFEQSSCIKLHIDIDTVPVEQFTCSSADLKEAQRLQQAIASIADEGTTEPRLRKLIQEGRTFLHSQPRHLHKDLRVAHRMIAYLCEVKSTLRCQNQAVDALTEQIKQMTTDKEDLLKQLAEIEESRKYERETALAVETSLREHCDNALKLYHGMIEMFNKAVTQNAELLRQAAAASTSTSAPHPETSAAPTPASASFNLLPVIDMNALKGIAIQDPKSNFLISPLPQFTGLLPSVFDAFTPLPELTEDADGEDGKTDEDDEELSTPDSSQHHRSIHGPQEVKQPSFMHHSVEASSALRPEGKVHEPSGLSRTAPYLEHRRSRSRSNPSRPTSRSQSPFDNSASMTLPMPPPPQFAASYQSQGSRPTAALSRDTYTPSPRNQDGEGLRTRLHDILRDSPTSSSLPSMSSGYFPSSFANREGPATSASSRDGRISPPPSRTSSSNSSKTPVLMQQSISDSVSRFPASGPHQQMPNKPLPSAAPNPLVGQRYCSASAEAKKLEEERRRKYKEEKYAMEQERQAAEVDSRSKMSSTTASSSANQASRREQPSNSIYGNPSTSMTNSNTSLTGSSLKRGSNTNSGTYGRSGTGLPPPAQEHGSGHHARQSSSANTSRATVLPSNPAGIYT